MCKLLFITVVHSTFSTQLPSYPPDSHHSDVVYWKVTQFTLSGCSVESYKNQSRSEADFVLQLWRGFCCLISQTCLTFSINIMLLFLYRHQLVADADAVSSELHQQTSASSSTAASAVSLQTNLLASEHLGQPVSSISLKSTTSQV